MKWIKNPAVTRVRYDGDALHPLEGFSFGPLDIANVQHVDNPPHGRKWALSFKGYRLHAYKTKTEAQAMAEAALPMLPWEEIAGPDDLRKFDGEKIRGLMRAIGRTPR